MEETIKFLEELIAEMDDTNWGISGITDYKEVTEDDEVYAELSDGATYEKQDNIYISQTQNGEDSFYGNIIYPITENKAVIVHYSC